MKTFDVVVVGAGIHGAGVAQAAAACGLQVLIIALPDWKRPVPAQN